MCETDVYTDRRLRDLEQRALDAEAALALLMKQVAALAAERKE